MRSIQNDQVIKGRNSQNKRKHPTINRNDERPKGAERGRRMQSLPSRKEPHDAEERPVNSAPSKELPKSEGPMPKVNTLVKKSPRDEKESQRTIQKEARPVPKEKEPVMEDKMKDKPKPVVSEPVFSKRPSVQDEKPKPPVVSSKKQDAGSSDGTPAPTEGKKPKVLLPPDDHGPIIETKKSSSQSSKTKGEDFNYYATDTGPEQEKRNSEDLTKEKTSPVQLRLQSEKSMKTEKPPPRGHVSRDISPSKSPRRGRDISPSKSPRRDISPGKYIKRFEKAKTMTERTEPSEFSDTSKKKREVTIMDPKDVRKEMGVDGEEGFPTEYEMGYQRRSKTFEQMNDEEKITYFKQELKLKPEQIRELTFHPKTTKPKQIHRAYTGMDTSNWRQKSARMKSAGRSKARTMIYRKVQTIPPSQRKSHMLSKLQGVVYRHINKVYGTSSKDTREKQFFERLARMQLTEYQKRYEKLADNEQKQLEMKYKQREQLQHLRKKFEDDAWRRFMTQYVTSKVMESEYRDRSEYGLPNELPKPHATRNQRHIYTMTPKSRYRSNRKKYANLFNFNSGPELKQGGKPLKFEGFDAIYIDTEDENGSPTKKRQDVQALMEEAMDLLQAHDDDVDMDEPRGRRPTRKSEPISRRYDRPHRSVTRLKRNSEAHSVKTYPQSLPFQPYTEGHSIRGSERVRPKPKPRPKTIRELYSKRTPVSSNRYKASEFSAMKQNLLKDSELMKKKQRDKDRNSGKSDEAKSTSGQESDKSTASKPSDRRPPPPDISPVKPPDALKNMESKTEQGTWRVENGNVHLDGPETQIEKDSERAKIVKDDKYKIPVSDKGHHVTTATTTTKTVTTTTTRKTADSPDKKTGDSESVSETVSTRQDRRGSITSQRRGSVSSIQPGLNRAPLSRTPSMATVRETGNRTVANTVQRTPSRASLLSTLQKPRPGITQTPRAPSRLSVLGDDKRTASRASVLGDDKNNIGVNGIGTGRVSRISSIAQGKSKPASNDRVNTNGTTEAVTDANTKQEEPVVNGHAATNGSAGSPVTVKLGENDGRVSPIVSMSSNTNDVERKVVSRRPSVRSNQLNIEQQRSSRQKSPSPSVRSRIVNGHTPMRKASNDSRSKIEGEANSNTQKSTSGPSVDVKRSEHISDVVTEVVKDNRSPVKSGSTEQSSKSSEDKAGSTQGKPVHGRSSRANNKDDRQSSVISQVRDPNLVNGHGDTKVKREEYENKGKERNQTKRPTRSRSRNGKGGKRSKSRSGERKRSTSRDKKRGKGKSTRFPDIENRPNSIAKTSPVSDNTNTNVSRNVNTDETVNERELSPKQGTEQWRDLVSKYMRQPSPTLGKPATRALLDASFDTDDDDDDIFARAQKRYALSISDAESDV